MSGYKFTVENQLNITDIFTIFEHYFEKGWKYGESHDFWEFVYVIEGEIQASRDDTVHKLSAGEMIFHKPLEIHKLAVPDADEALVFIFTFNMDGNLAPFFKEKMFRLNRNQINIINQILKYVRSNYTGSVRREKNDYTYTTMYIEPKQDDNIYIETLISYMKLLFLSLASDGIIGSAEEDSRATAFYDAIKYMKANIDKKIAVNEIAENVKISSSSLKRLFDEYLGVPVHRYFLTLKIQKATELLQNGYTVSEIAEKLDFSSQSHFSKVFKDMTGNNPSTAKKDI